MLQYVIEFLRVNQTVIVVGVLTGAFNWAAKPRTPEELAAMHPRRAAFHRFMAATFPDPQKAI